MAGRTLDLSEETWSVLLKVVLGITDSLLSERTSDGARTGPTMGDELCDHLLRVSVDAVLEYCRKILHSTSSFSVLTRSCLSFGYDRKRET